MRLHNVGYTRLINRVAKETQCIGVDRPGIRQQRFGRSSDCPVSVLIQLRFAATQHRRREI